jgi:hypothetical protein
LPRARARSAESRLERLAEHRLQFFGEVNIDARGGDMTVDLRDINGLSDRKSARRNTAVRPGR